LDLTFGELALARLEQSTDREVQSFNVGNKMMDGETGDRMDGETKYRRERELAG
jgi:hypothetical protein